jgi:hypothetical protein
MTRSHTITPKVTFVVAVALLVPSAAQANPLLSGYGGPGQGSQVILGSKLIGPPSGGGGGTGGSPSASGSTVTPSAPASSAGSSASSGAGGHRGTRHSLARVQAASPSSLDQ